MTRKEFDTYPFSINTKIKFDEFWHEITGVDFERRTIDTKAGYVVYCEDVLEIKD